MIATGGDVDTAAQHSHSLAETARAIDAIAESEMIARFTKLRGYGPANTPADVTQFAMDTTFALVDAVNRCDFFLTSSIVYLLCIGVADVIFVERLTCM